MNPLGKKPDENAQRDAVHIAIIPVMAGEPLTRGRCVDLRFDGGGKLAAFGPNGERPAVGIVDPFYMQLIQPGERFWLLMFPDTVTNLRHDWTHPVFEKAQRSELTHATIEDAQKYLRFVAEEAGLSYNALLRYAKVYLQDGEHLTLREDIPECLTSREGLQKFWDAFEIVTRIGAPKGFIEQSFAGCSC